MDSRNSQETQLRLDAIEQKYSPFASPILNHTPFNLPPPKLSRLIYDCEIINAIPGSDRLPGIEYCKGWGDFAGMGVAVIGYQINEGPPVACLSVGDFKLVLENFSGVVIGFNSLRFDDPLLAAAGLPIKTGYDLLPEIRIAAGLAGSPRKPGRGQKKLTYALGAIAQANGLGGKTENGALAPVLWQRGEHQRVIDYCLSDVALTSQILDLGLSGNLIDPNTGDYLLLPVPFQHVAIIASEVEPIALAEASEIIDEFGLLALDD